MLVYTCPKARAGRPRFLCGGLADRIKGVISLLLIAMVRLRAALAVVVGVVGGGDWAGGGTVQQLPPEAQPLPDLRSRFLAMAHGNG